jgi:hypothetical protein
MKGIFALILAVAVVGSAATAGSAKSTPTSGRLHVTKECSQYNGTAGSFCTILHANIDAITPGMQVVYSSAPSDGTLDSEIVLKSADGTNKAYGHVTLDFAKAKGLVTFSGGIGALAGFQAEARVSLDSGGVWHWNGTYSFSE